MDWKVRKGHQSNSIKNKFKSTPSLKKRKRIVNENLYLVSVRLSLILMLSIQFIIAQLRSVASTIMSKRTTNDKRALNSPSGLKKNVKSKDLKNLTRSAIRTLSPPRSRTRCKFSKE